MTRAAWLFSAIAATMLAIDASVAARNREQPAGSQTAAATQQTPVADPATCNGLLQTDRMPAVLAAVPRYQSTYVLLVPQRFADKVPSADAPALKTLEIGLHADSAAVDVAKALGLTRVKEYPFDRSSPIQPVVDAKDQKLDAAIMWAPLAGLALIELEGVQVAVYTVDKPHAAPSLFHVTPASEPCAAAVRDELDADGVLPAELLVPVDVRSLLPHQVPRFDLAQAREGGPLYNEICSKCHGHNAVADPHGLAPVDLRMSVPRFSYPGFAYILLNGRPDRSMPPLRGTVTEDQIALVYQYLKARTNKLLPDSYP